MSSEAARGWQSLEPLAACGVRSLVRLRQAGHVAEELPGVALGLGRQLRLHVQRQELLATAHLLDDQLRQRVDARAPLAGVDAGRRDRCRLGLPAGDRVEDVLHGELHRIVPPVRVVAATIRHKLALLADNAIV